MGDNTRSNLEKAVGLWRDFRIQLGYCAKPSRLFLPGVFKNLDVHNLVMETADQRVEREDLHLFINAGLTTTGQGGYYHGAEAERLSLAFLHRYIAGNYRPLYTLCLASGLNDHNLSHALFTLLQAGSPDERSDRERENALLGCALKRLPPHRAYRLFERLAKNRVNNRRTRGLIKSYLESRPLAFDAVKYRRRFRLAMRHAHFKAPDDIARFVFEGARGKPYSTALLETYRQAHYDTSSIYKLPFTVAQGLARLKGIEPSVFMKKIAPMMTEREKLREQSSGSEDFDAARLDMVELCVYYLSCDRERRLELLPVLRDRARRQAEEPGLNEALRGRRIASVLDRSRSSIGARTARRRPLAVALAVHLVLESLGETYNAHWSHPVKELLDLHPLGHTSLGEPLLEALARRPELVILVSDGRENAPRGAAGAIARTMASRLPRQAPLFVHLNPVFNPDDFMPMSLGECWSTVGVRRMEDLSTALAFARFAEGRGGSEEIRAYLTRRSEELLRAL